MARWVEPMGLLHGRGAFAAVAAGAALPLNGGGAAFAIARLIEGGRTLGVFPIANLPEEWVEDALALTPKVPAFAGLEAPGRPLVMGILDLALGELPDDGGAPDARAVVAAGHAMLEAGADLLDIGGDAWRGTGPVAPDDELAHLVPALRELAKAAPVGVRTSHAAVMRAALDAGAEFVSDATALRHDPDATTVVAAAGCPVVLTYRPGVVPDGAPGVAGSPTHPGDPAIAAVEFLAGRVLACEAAGIARGNIAVDPGIGLGGLPEEELDLLDRLPLLHGLGCAVLVGAPGHGAGDEPADGGAKDGMPGGLGVAVAAASRGAAVLRVRDVAEAVAMLRLWQALAGGVMP